MRYACLLASAEALFLLSSNFLCVEYLGAGALGVGQRRDPKLQFRGFILPGNPVGIAVLSNVIVGLIAGTPYLVTDAVGCILDSVHCLGN
jgi:hypothetical protein